MRPVISLCMVLSWSLVAAISKEREMSEDEVIVSAADKILRGHQNKTHSVPSDPDHWWAVVQGRRGPGSDVDGPHRHSTLNGSS